MKYVYKCWHCEHRQNEEHSMRENPVIKCEKCGSEKTSRVLQASPFILQNGGWARDGYK